MENLFEPSSYLDPNPFDSSSFLTFSSFADLTSCSDSSPIISDTWDDLFTSSSSSPSSSSSYTSSSFSSLFPLPPTKTPLSAQKQPPAPPRSAYSASSDCSTPDLGTYDPFEIINSAFEDSYSAGIFHIPSQAGPSKLSAADAVPVPGLTHRVTSSTDSNWDSPLITPALNGPPGVNSPKDLSLGAFSWDDAPTTLASSSSSYTPPTVAYSPAPLRVASNPSLGSAKNPRAIKPIASMPSLTEESDSFQQWFDGSLLDQQTTEPVTDEALVDNFDWVFGDYGLGESLPMEGTIFAAFQESGSHAKATAGTSTTANNTPVTTNSASVPLTSQPTFSSSIQTSTSPIEATTDNNQNNLNDLSWFNPSTDLSDPSMQNFDHSQTFTIDPLVLGGNSDVGSRPASAPKAEAGEGMGLLSAPMAGQMSRSLTAPGFVSIRSAPTSDLFSYDPQPIYAQYQQPQQQQQQQQPSYAPSQILPVRPLPQRRASHGLTISVHQPSFSTFTQPSDLPPTPQSAPFTSTSMSHMQAQAHSQAYTPQYSSHLGAPVPMTRAGTQPLPMTRRMSSDATSGAGSRHVSGAGGPPMPAHLIRAQAIVQMQEAKEEQQRQELRRQAASRRVNMAEASVMQPLNPTPAPTSTFSHTHAQMQPRSQPAIVGWEGPSSLPSQSNMPSGMVQNQQPMVVHPPPSYYGAVQTQHPPPHQFHPAPQQAPPPHRVHPPPHPGMGLGISSSSTTTTTAGRPMARLPSPKTRKVTSPSKRSPSGKRRGQMQPGGFSWGEATFINFTPDDAEKLLTGVAPSGSQAKRKREEDAARLGMGMGMSMGMAGVAMGQEYLALDMDREGSKRSRTGE